MLIQRDRDTFRSYLEDSSNLSGGHAEMIAFPEDVGDICGIIREANARGTPVSIAGGGTGTTGARIPFGGIVMSMEKFNKIIRVSPEAMSATVETGVVVEELQNACAREGLFYAAHPTEGTAFVGGTIATNASGARSLTYGPTRRQVRRLAGVLADGTPFSVRRGERFLTKKDPRLRLDDGRAIDIPLPGYRMPDVKNSAGYYAREGMDAIDLFIGQEGTLSVITEAEFGLAEKPSKIFACYVFFKRVEDSWDFAAAARSRHPLSLEYFDWNSLALLRPKGRAIPRGAAAAIFFEEETLPPGGGENDIIEHWGGLIRAHGASLDDTWVAMTGKDLDAFNELRHAVPEAINEIVRRRGMRKLSTDIAVPENAFVTMMRFYVDTLRGSDMEYAVFGHIGENHVHVNVIPRSEGEAGAAQGICMAFVRKAVSLGGTVSAEHGIGKTRHAYLEAMYGKQGIVEMARIKKALDPNWILGLDNIFPRETLKLI